jgi:hypothetical protein
MWVNFGASNNEGFTLFHHAESICNVPYRSKVIFKRTVILKKNKRKIIYEYLARKRLISYNFDKAVSDMLKNKIFTYSSMSSLDKLIINFNGRINFSALAINV